MGARSKGIAAHLALLGLGALLVCAGCGDEARTGARDGDGNGDGGDGALAGPDDLAALGEEEVGRALLVTSDGGLRLAREARVAARIGSVRAFADELVTAESAARERAQRLLGEGVVVADPFVGPADPLNLQLRGELQQLRDILGAGGTLAFEADRACVTAQLAHLSRTLFFLETSLLPAAGTGPLAAEVRARREELVRWIARASLLLGKLPAATETGTDAGPRPFEPPDDARPFEPLGG